LDLKRYCKVWRYCRRIGTDLFDNLGLLRNL
jgi:hypothetical protein